MGSPRRASSADVGSKDGPGAIASGAGMATGIDGEPAVGAGGAARGEHPLGLPGERHHLLGGGPEASGGQPAGILLLALVLGRLPGDDDEQPLALVVAQAQLADGPLGLAGLRRRRL